MPPCFPSAFSHCRPPRFSPIKSRHEKNIFYAWLLLGLSQFFLRAESALETGWQNPPNEARLRAYWWRLNGNVTKVSITHDLEEMKAKGFGGAVIIDANGSSQEGNAEVAHGPTFFSPAWRDLFKHTLREADRLGLEMSRNDQSGWNLGGTTVTKEDAAKNTCGQKRKSPAARISKSNCQNQKRGKIFTATAPSSAPLFEEISANPGEQDADAARRISKASRLRFAAVAAGAGRENREFACGERPFSV